MGGLNVTQVDGSIKGGKKGERIALELDGKLSASEWERFKAELEQVLKKFGIRFADLQIKKTTKKKKKKPR